MSKKDVDDIDYENLDDLPLMDHIEWDHRITEVNSNTEESSNKIYLPDREARIAQLAYCKAESRGFESGHELEDWLEAEREFMP